MDLLESIKLEEQEFPRLFARYEERPYGTLFFNESIPDHHDSNHAVLYPERVRDLRAVLEDIVAFYQAKGLQPALFHPFVEDYFVDNAKTLKACGFSLTITLDRRIMVLEGTQTKPVSGALQIKRMTAADMDTDFIPDEDEYLRALYANSLHKENHYVFVGYHDAQPASLVSFHVSEYGCTRFDEMTTADRFKGRGFARDMNSFAVNYCLAHGLPTPYQWPAHDTSERITAEAGFRVAYLLPGGYATYDRVSHYTA